MSEGVNKVILLGNLGKDAELNYTQGGTARCRFSVATTKGWTGDQGDKKEKTEWHNIVIWGKLGESLTKYLTKGKRIYIEGEIQTRSWEENGSKRYITEINAQKVVLLGEPHSESRSTQEDDIGDRKHASADGRGDEKDGGKKTVDDEDIPF